MEWDQIRYFLAVARGGSLSRAAEQLETSHVTVARHIHRLEEQEGVKLFDRRQNGYLLTPAAESLIPLAMAVEAQCQDFFRLMRGSSETSRGVLTVSTPENAVFNFAPDFAEFARQHPETELIVNASTQLQSLEKREADVVLRMTDKPPENLVGRRLKSLMFSPFASRDYLERVDVKATGGDWIVFQRNKNDTTVADVIASLPRQQRIAMRSNSNAEVLAAVIAGAGIGMICEDIAKTEPTLMLVYPTLSAPADLWLLTHQDLRNATRVQQFMRFMSERLSA